jgi:hypothetical protein
MTKPIIVDISVNKQGSDRDLRLYARLRTPEDVQTVQSAIDAFFYDLMNDVRDAQKEGLKT